MNRVGPDDMMIVPVGQTERAAIPSESQSLTEQLERAIGYQPPRWSRTICEDITASGRRGTIGRRTVLPHQKSGALG